MAALTNEDTTPVIPTSLAPLTREPLYPSADKMVKTLYVCRSAAKCERKRQAYI